ncbi:MAG: twin-arginine translocase subunit TatB [Dehalococcoidia bacterium]|nr:twin-arginine translocase subunit TatB [Dehalococcoidia bacterium]
MQFFGVGLFELTMVLLVALLVVGPDKLPQTAREIGKGVRTLRRYAFDVRQELGEGFNELTQELEETRSELRDLRRELTATGSLVEEDLREAGAAIEGEFVDAEEQPDQPEQPASHSSSNGSSGASARRTRSAGRRRETED